MTATHNLPGEVARGVPRITPSLARAVSEEGNISTSLLYAPYWRENPQLTHVFDYRYKQINDNLPKLIREESFNAEELRVKIQREFMVRAALLQRGLVYASKENAQLSKYSGLPILDERMGVDWLEIYKQVPSDRNINLFECSDPLLYNLALEESKKYGPEAERFDDLTSEEMINLWEGTGNLGIEFSNRVLTKQNRRNRVA